MASASMCHLTSHPNAYADVDWGISTMTAVADSTKSQLAGETQIKTLTALTCAVVSSRADAAALRRGIVDVIPVEASGTGRHGALCAVLTHQALGAILNTCTSCQRIVHTRLSSHTNHPPSLVRRA